MFARIAGWDGNPVVEEPVALPGQGGILPTRTTTACLKTSTQRPRRFRRRHLFFEHMSG
jgi:hypothetical protein